MKISTINVDMDGVLYNWSGQYGYMEGYSYLGRWFDLIDKSGKTYQEVLQENMDRHASNGLYLDGERVRGADRLITYLFELKKAHGLTLNILSAIPHKSTVKDVIARDKTQWLKNVGYHHVFDNIIFSDGSWGKSLYAAPDAVLIDDFDDTIVRYRELNSPAILHRTYEKTITELLEML